ncbi:MAG: hopanoid biosynthesis-associated protein HpnK [Candidatus Scalindua sp.]|nr:hopanoid biosynthesis-associated protein HpnK [Candidatus Scalindua sp.]MCR4344532.1 hopanoid biosynthesis-associated protein HpnK [Candidatus Scalindua sp.]
MRAVIINADDFGASKSINNAIIKAYREGVLTSASLMVNGEAFEDAVEQARNNPNLSVGIHLVLVQGRSTKIPDEIPGLVNAEGNFPDNAILAGLRFFFFKSLRVQIENELRTQMQKFASTKLKLSHINSHLNIHMHPSVLDIVLKLADEFGVKNLRLTKDYLFINLKLDRSALVYKLSHFLIFGILTKIYRKRLLKRGFRFTDVVYGLLQSGDMNETYVSDLLYNLNEGISEIYFHPDSLPSEDWYGKPANYKFLEEFHTLLSQKIKRIVKKNSIRLVDYTFLKPNKAQLLCQLP